MLRKTIRTVFLPVLLILFVFLFSSAVSAEGYACDGCTAGTFNGSPACLKNGNLHLCNLNFPNNTMLGNIRWHLDQDGDKEISIEAVNGHTVIHGGHQSATTLKGVEYFINLEELYASKSNFSTIDLSKNTKLRFLDVSNTPLNQLDLTVLPNLNKLICSNTNLKTLDLSNCKNLTQLECKELPTEELDLSFCPNLSTVDCSGSKLKSLTLGTHNDLTKLNCNGNQIEKLDLSRVPQLTDLDCEDNCLTALDLSKCPNLQVSNLGTQSSSLRGIIKQDTGSESYIVDLGSVIGIENIRNITELSTNVYPKPQMTLDYETGIVHMAKYVRYVVYSIKVPSAIVGSSNPYSISIQMYVDCQHVWNDATCASPRACSICKKTEEDALPHTWTPATKTEPSVCTVCGKVGDHPLEHVWLDASCRFASQCKFCGQKQGKALGHDYVTKSTAGCKTVEFCTRCGITGHKRVSHTWAYSAPSTLECVKCGETMKVADYPPKYEVDHVCQWFSNFDCRAAECIYCHKPNYSISHRWVGPTFFTAAHCINPGCHAKGEDCYLNQYLIHITLTVDAIYLLFAIWYLHWLEKKIHISLTTWYLYYLNRKRSYC